MRALRALAASLAGIVLALLLFVLAGWIGSSIPRNQDAVEPAHGITILVDTNGTHTGIVMPIVTPVKDWRTTFPNAALPRPSDGQMPTHIAVGWGEKQVFLHVATWGDLHTSTALHILFLGGPAVMRVIPYVRPAPDADYRPVVLTPAQYARLVTGIEASLPPPGPDGSRQWLTGNDPDAAYYPALGHYTLANTCNTWVGNRLAEAGVKMGLWTPFAGEVMKWVPRP